MEADRELGQPVGGSYLITWMLDVGYKSIEIQILLVKLIIKGTHV